MIIKDVHAERTPNFRISTADGKYIVSNYNGTLKVERNGKSWPEKDADLVGDGFVLSLVQELENMFDTIVQLTEDKLTSDPIWFGFSPSDPPQGMFTDTEQKYIFQFKNGSGWSDTCETGIGILKNALEGSHVYRYRRNK